MKASNGRQKADGWAHEIKFDGYRMQLRVQDGAPRSRRASGLDWTAKFGAIAKAAANFPDGIIDGELVALDHNGAPDFAALQAALSENRSKDLIFFAFDLLFDDGTICAKPAAKRKQRLQKMLSRHEDRERHSVRRALRRRGRRGPAISVQTRVGGHRFEEAR